VNRGPAGGAEPEPEPASTFRCGLCGGERAEPVLVGHDRQHGIPGRWQLSRCVGCGLVQIDPLPARDRLGALYPPAYYAHRASGSTFRPIRPSAARRFVLRHRLGYPPGRGGPLERAAAALLAPFVSRRKLLPWIGAGVLLDVGCGVGSALWRLRAAGWTVHGVETDDEAAAVGRAQGLDIRTGDLVAAGFPAAHFDLVRLSHVLEHVPAPLEVLREVRRILKPDGRLWMALPNIGSRNFERHGARWFPLELPRHLFHFTPDTIRAACAAAGLRVVAVRFRSSADLHAQTLEYARRERAAASGAAPAGRPLPQRRLLVRALRPLVWWLDRRGRGDLMEVTCAPAEAGGVRR
jgi:SAM-dependent methyltransferase